VVIVKPGDVFGRLCVVQVTRDRLQSKRAVEVQCRCGSPPFVARLDHLRARHTTSCRCAQREHARRRGLTRNVFTGQFGSSAGGIAGARKAIVNRLSGFPIDEGRTLLEVTEDALDLFQGTAEVFGDLSRQHVRVR